MTSRAVCILVLASLFAAAPAAATGMPNATATVAATEFRAFAGVDAVKGIRVAGESELTRSRLDALTDRATYLAFQNRLSLAILLEATRSC